MRIRHPFLWCTLIHLGTNFWLDEGNDHGGPNGQPGNKTYQLPASPTLRFDRTVWDAYLRKMRAGGVNTLILDIGDGMIFDSHPEIAVEGAWTRKEMEAELIRLSEMGFEVIPKLNFSTTHDVWLKDYARMVSSPIYYQVCKDLIDEACEIFQPRYLHLGMDEENYELQKYHQYVTVRQNDLWWNDLLYLVDCTEENGVRPMIWSDYAWSHPEEFAEKCPKSVVQCAWYYYGSFVQEELDEWRAKELPIFQFMKEQGFEVFPTGSVEFVEENMERLTEYCAQLLPAEQLIGFMQTTWVAVTTEWEQVHDVGIRTLKASREWYEKNRCCEEEGRYGKGTNEKGIP